jgi:hypothetical protein
LTEKLKEQEKIEISREKVRRILRSEGISTPRKRRAFKHRSRRERRQAEGMMLQVDGSPHDWLQGRAPRLCVIGAIDALMHFYPQAVRHQTAVEYLLERRRKPTCAAPWRRAGQLRGVFDQARHPFCQHQKEECDG